MLLGIRNREEAEVKMEVAKLVIAPPYQMLIAQIK